MGGEVALKDDADDVGVASEEYPNFASYLTRLPFVQRIGRKKDQNSLKIKIPIHSLPKNCHHQ